MKMPNDYQWRASLERALQENPAPPDRYFQLATIDSNGHPKNRTLVFREFDEGGGLLAITDCRSAKATELDHCNTVELCWYFRETREQFRIAGLARLIAAEADRDGAGRRSGVDEVPKQESALRARIWRGLSAAAQRQFFWPAPGAVADNSGQFVERPSHVHEPVGAAPDTFAVILIQALEVDHLTLGSEHLRINSTLESGHWRATRINP